MTVQTIYDHFAETIASMNPAKVLEIRAPQAASERLESLIEKKNEHGLSAVEKDELDHFLVLERLIRLAKAHARLQLAGL
ncbi:MAG: hypothetical protein JNL70_07620 [Saprospiraceae bacterium]|nr:hypothetical protein [Saprospiraceae bacterium]